VIADRHGAAAAARVAAQQPDRCPCPRPFSAEATDCAAFQPVSFVAADALNRPLQPAITCRHLTVGTTLVQGRFYPRCGLGGQAERARWVATVGPERVAVMAALQEEFDAATRAQREELHAARADLMVAPEAARLRQRLERLLDDFLAAASSFVEANRERLEEVGLPAASLLPLVEDWTRAWTESRDPAAAYLRRAPASLDTPLHALPGPLPRAGGGRELVGRPTDRRPLGAGAAAEEVAEDSELLLDTASLRVVRTVRPPRLRVEGELDAAGAARFAEVHAAATAGGGDRHLDLGGLGFSDVAGLRALVAASRQLDRGARLVVHHMPAQLRRALAIAGWADLPALLIVPDGETAP
jgi:anti-anti-sigma factor